MEKQFRALRTIGTLLKILAWIVLVLAILGALLFVIGGAAGSLNSIGNAIGQDVSGFAAEGAIAAIAMGATLLLGGVVYFLILYATAEAIYVILSIEENTRLTAMAMSGRASM